MGSVRLSCNRDRDGMLYVTVPSRDVLRVRRAVVSAGCHPIGIVKAAPIANGTRVRMVIAVPAALLREVEESVMRELGELTARE